MARTRYIVCYDISNPKRLREVAKTCESFGARLQYSVFECPMDDIRFENFQAALHKIIHHEKDQVLFISLGVEGVSAPFQIKAIGQPYTVRSRVIVI